MRLTLGQHCIVAFLQFVKLHQAGIQHLAKSVVNVCKSLLIAFTALWLLRSCCLACHGECRRMGCLAIARRLRKSSLT